MADPSSPQGPTPPPLAESLPEAEPARPAARPPAPRPPGPRPAPAAPAPVSQEAQQRIREANLLRMRGQLPAAERELMRAIELAPTDAQAFEMLGDIQRQAGRAADALTSYTRAAELPAAPGTRASLESKMARMALERDRAAAGQIESGALMRDNVLVTVVGSAVMPGAGQMIGGRPVRGVVIFLAWLASLVLIAVLPQTRELIAGLKSEMSGGQPAPIGDALFVIVLLVINVAVWLFGMIEAAVMSRRAREERTGWEQRI